MVVVVERNGHGMTGGNRLWMWFWSLGRCRRSSVRSFVIVASFVDGEGGEMGFELFGRGIRARVNVLVLVAVVDASTAADGFARVVPGAALAAICLTGGAEEIGLVRVLV